MAAGTARTDDGLSIAYRSRGDGTRNVVFLRERLGSVRVPALVVSSARDPVHSTERDIVASLPEARLEILDCGPEIPMELPVELAHLIEKFVAELP
jgi:pimeloyl-ACP methyl ester carboxylesterase